MGLPPVAHSQMAINSLEQAVPLFSRAFVRKRIISLATTISFAATSLALAQNPKGAPHSRAAASQGNQEQFLFENDLAVSKKATDLLIKPSGDVDHDFVAAMIPQSRRHRSLAGAELEYGHNEELQRLAKSIVHSRKLSSAL